MIITIRNDGVETSFDINNIADEQKKQEATVLVQKVGNLQIVIEALDFASRTHRGILEDILVACDESKIEPERARDEEGKFIADDPSTPDVNEAWTTAGEPEVKEKK